MGAKLALDLCQSFGDRVAAAASIHPGNLVAEDANSPHLHLAKVSAELYFDIADDDAAATPEQIAELEQALKAQGVRYEMEWHPGARHGFMMSGRPGLYNRHAAEKELSRLEALFDRHLR